ncbi:MAG TPA: CHAT domain-containing protein [Syntrophorhabdaceae bacterium]|nr:CHAT domain-containing protein [Syntrophorhabdaceae bacterium]
MEQLTYLDFELEIQRSGDRYVARVIHSPAGEATQYFNLPFSQDKLENLVLKLGKVRSSTRRIQSAELEAARELGGKLFDAVIADNMRACFKSSYDQALEKEGRGLRVKLRLQDAPELADIPWEYLFDPLTDRFIAQSNLTPIVRYLAISEKTPPLAVKFPINILVMISSPPDYACLDVQREKTKMKEALEGLSREGKVRLEFMESSTLTGLERRLRRQDCHVFHYIGHGGFDRRTEEGVLALEDDRGQSWLAGAHRVGMVLHDCRSLRLAVFNACEGARNSQADPFAGLAASVVRQGIPAVVGMQFEITDSAAIIFAREFYGAIAEGFPVDAALSEARKAIYLAPNDVEWGTPVLYMRSPDGVLFTIGEAFSAAPQAAPPDRSHTAPEEADGRGTSEESFEDVLRECRKAAGQGDMDAQYTLGLIYREGKVVPQDDKESVKWYRMAAGQGHAVAQNDLGFMYQNGRGVTRDYSEAVRWYRLSADQGQTLARYNLGCVYENGWGVPRDNKEAARWYRMAADQGDADAQYNLGRMYADGIGVPRDDKESVKWYRMAAKKGSDRAKKFLRKKGLQW